MSNFKKHTAYTIFNVDPLNEGFKIETRPTADSHRRETVAFTVPYAQIPSGTSLQIFNANEEASFQLPKNTDPQNYTNTPVSLEINGQEIIPFKPC